MRVLLALCVLLFTPLGIAAALQTPTSPGDYPNKPLRWVVPFPAGGPADILARIVGESLSEGFGQPIVIDNRAGATSVPSLAEWWQRVYGVREAALTETAKRLTYDADGAYQATGTPKTLQHKFILEDVPTGLMPTSALGLAAGVPGEESQACSLRAYVREFLCHDTRSHRALPDW